MLRLSGARIILGSMANRTQNTDNVGAYRECPRCGTKTTAGFCTRADGLSFVHPDKFESLLEVSTDKSIFAFVRQLLSSRTEYYRAYLCKTCNFYAVDLSSAFNRKQADELAHSLNPKSRLRKST